MYFNTNLNRLHVFCKVLTIKISLIKLN